MIQSKVLKVQKVHSEIYGILKGVKKYEQLGNTDNSIPNYLILHSYTWLVQEMGARFSLHLSV